MMNDTGLVQLPVGSLNTAGGSPGQARVVLVFVRSCTYTLRINTTGSPVDFHRIKKS